MGHAPVTSPLGVLRPLESQKLDLSLWVKLQQASEDRVFEVLLHLADGLNDDIRCRLLESGFSTSDYYRYQSETMVPGRITKSALLEFVLPLVFVRRIEGLEALVGAN